MSVSAFLQLPLRFVRSKNEGKTCQRVMTCVSPPQSGEASMSAIRKKFVRSRSSVSANPPKGAYAVLWPVSSMVPFPRCPARMPRSSYYSRSGIPKNSSRNSNYRIAVKIAEFENAVRRGSKTNRCEPKQISHPAVIYCNV